MKGVLSNSGGGGGSSIGQKPLDMIVQLRRRCPSFYTRYLSIFVFILLLGLWWLNPSIQDSILTQVQRDEKVIISSDSPSAEPRDTNCTYHNFTCLEVYHCGFDDSTTISVYIYPIQQFFDEQGNDITPPMSREYGEMLQVIAESPYHSHNPDTACFFIPSVDLLNENLINPRHVSQILASLKW